MNPLMFTVEQRDRVLDRLLEMARNDPRIVAAAMVGSLALGGGDRWSDLDLSFGLDEKTSVAEILRDWTLRIEAEMGAVHLFDLPFLSTMYRVFLFPGALQVDLSFTPGAEFGALGPKFELLYGSTVERAHIPAPAAPHQFGLAVHHAVRARICIARNRAWEAEYWIDQVRDVAMSLACARRGLPARYSRGNDRLPADALRLFIEARPRSLDPAELLRALGRAIEALLRESEEVRGMAAQLEAQLHGLVSERWPEG
jgi:predicted nucleotidyltransferase